MIYRYLILFLFVFSLSYGETFDQVLRKALQKNPYLKAVENQSKEVEGEIKSARSIPNPEVSLMFGRLYSQSDESGAVLTDFSVEQPLKLWGTRKKAIEQALTKRSAYQYMFETEKRKFISGLYNAFYTALFKKEVMKIKQIEYSITKDIYRFVEKSYQLGEETKLNLFRAEKDLKVAQIELKQAETEYNISLKNLSSLAGFEIKDVEGEISAVKDPIDIDIDQIPQISYLKKLIETAEKGIALQKALAKPQVSIEFAASEDEVDLGKYEFGIGIKASIPVFYRNQGEILKLIYKKKSYINLLKQKKIYFRSKLNSLKEKYSLLKKQIQEIDQQIIPSVHNALKLGERSFKLKEITLFELSDLRKQFIQALIYRAQTLQQIHHTYSEYIKIGGLR